MSSAPQDQRSRTFIRVLLIGIMPAAVVAIAMLGNAPHAIKQVNSPTGARLAAMAGIRSMPLYFEPNLGQSDPRVRYASHTPRSSLFLTDDATVITMVGGTIHKGPAVALASQPLPPDQLIEAAVRIRFVGANPHPRFTGLDPLRARVNYLIGDDPSKVHRDIPTFGRVKMSDVYPGIDVIYYGQPGALEYDIVAAPGADTSKIKFSIEGPTETTTDANGDVMIKTPAGVIAMLKPRIYQAAADGSRTLVSGTFALSKHGSIVDGVMHRQVGLVLAGYDHRRAIVIDPVLPIMPYSTFIGGSGQSSAPLNLEQFSNLTANTKLTMSDVGLDVALDGSNHAYVTGVAFSTDFPTRSAFQWTLTGFNAPPNQNPNAFISKFDYTKSGDASLIYSTYYGGSGDHAAGDAGHGNGDLAFGIAVDASGQAYIVGQTYSTDLNGRTSCGAFGQTNNQAHTSTNVGFIAKLGAAGDNLVYACYIDGSNNATEARVALYPAGCGTNTCKAYMVGSTQSTKADGFPVTANAFQGDLKATNGKSNATFIVVHEDGQSLDYASYYGGSGNGTNADSGLGVAVDGNGLGYITGGTYSSDLAVPNGAFTSYKGGANKTSDVFVAIFDPSKSGNSSLTYGTYLGGSGQVGTISGLLFNFSLALGDVGDAITIDSNGKVWVAGLAASTDFQNIPGTVSPVFQSSNLANTDAGPPATAGFVTQIDTTKAGSAQILYSTYFGGGGFEIDGASFGETGSVGFGDAILDLQVVGGKIYIVGATTSASSTDPATTSFPLSANVLACTNSSFLTSNLTSGISINGVVFVPLTAWAAELDPSQATADAQLIFSTLLSSSGMIDVASGMRVDSNGNIVISGLTYGTDYPVTPNAYELNNNAALSNRVTNGFLTVLNPAGGACPTPFTKPSPTITATRTPTPAPTASATPTATATRTATPTVTATATNTPTTTPTATASIAPTPVPANLKLSSNKLVGKTLKFPSELYGGQGLTSPPVIVTVKNPGGKKGVEVQLESIDPEPPANFKLVPGDSDCPNPGTLAAGTPCKIALTFTPTGFGANEGTLTLTDNAHNNPQKLKLVGAGVHGIIKVAPKTLAFGGQTVGAPSAAKPVVLTNNTGVPFSIMDITSTDPTEFTPDGSCANTTLPANGGACTINVTFTPAKKGARTAKLKISDDAAGSPQKVTMTGKGT